MKMYNVKIKKNTYNIYVEIMACPVISYSNNANKFSCNTNIVSSSPYISTSHGTCIKSLVTCIYVI